MLDRDDRSSLRTPHLRQFNRGRDTLSVISLYLHCPFASANHNQSYIHDIRACRADYDQITSVPSVPTLTKKLSGISDVIPVI